MRLEHREHPGRAVRLAYCLNLHPAADLDGALEGLRTVSLPLAERLAPERASGGASGFGVGPWLPASLAHALDADVEQCGRLVEALWAGGLAAFTFNAFPLGDFHRPGLKRDVFRPTWAEPERLAATLAAARVAAALNAGAAGEGHVSLSTHAGGFAADLSAADRELCATNLARCAEGLARLEEENGVRIVLAVEAEPRSSANDTAALPALYERVCAAADEPERVRRHLGACLDACHAAVEFEEPAAALANATAHGYPLGKLQFSSALRLVDPDANAAGRALLLEMDEPVYLHQVTGRRGSELARADDLPDLVRAWEAGNAAWRGCDEWRCHFHVPVDLDTAGEGLGTTRPEADALLAAALATPERWGSPELHVEVETYTWSVLDAHSHARGPGALLDGLEREVRHVLSRVAEAGWRPPQALGKAPGPR